MIEIRAMDLKKMTNLKGYFKKGFQDWRNELFEYRFLIFLSLIIVVITGFLDYYSGVYVTKVKAEIVPDLILDHIGPYNLWPIYVYGYLILVVTLFMFPLLVHIRMLHITISQFSMLVMLRALFMIFTHLQSPPEAISVGFPWIFKGLSFQNDMFFSGHAAIPFLGYLLFNKSLIKYFFLAGSITMAITVLLMHIHYSIDVFSAYFIAYCSYRIVNKILTKI
jgi:hypothetical protein